MTTRGREVAPPDDFEVFQAWSHGRSVGHVASRSLPATPLQSPAPLPRLSAKTVARRTKILQRDDNSFEIFEEDEPVCFERVNMTRFRDEGRTGTAVGGGGGGGRARHATLADTQRSVSLRDDYTPRDPATPPPAPPPHRKPLQRSTTVYDDDVKITNDDDNRRCSRLRSFRTTRDGLVNRGDSVKYPSRPRPLQVTRAATLPPEEADGAGLPRCQSLKLDERLAGRGTVQSGYTPSFHVDIIGGHGTGKRRLLRQLLTSEYVGDDECTLGE